MKLIYADFMKIDSQGRLRLDTLGTRADLTSHCIQLVSGMQLVFYNEDVDEKGNKDDLIVEGIVDFDKETSRWVATIDWDAVKNRSEYSPDELVLMGLCENGV